MLWFLGSYTSKKVVGFFEKSLTQRELLCVWNTFNHDPTRFFFHPLRNVITHSLDLSSSIRREKTHTQLTHTTMTSTCSFPMLISFSLWLFIFYPLRIPLSPSTYPEEAWSIEEGEPQMFKRLFRPQRSILDQKGGILKWNPSKNNELRTRWTLKQ